MSKFCNITPFLRLQEKKTAAAAILMSGQGTNAVNILEYLQSGKHSFEVSVIFTDNRNSNAGEISKRFGIPIEVLDIKEFYAANGEESIKLDTEKRQHLRRVWSAKVWDILQKYDLDFAIFAGFVPLTDISTKLPCLNVHPGDLTVEKNGERRYAGLHYLPVERAILDGRKFLRSSVILVQDYSGDGKKDLDSGPVLGVSAEVEIDFAGRSLEQLKEVASKRTEAPFDDILRDVAKKNVDKLKVDGDHAVLPKCIEYFACGRYGNDEKNSLFFLDDSGKWRSIVSVEFFPGEKTPQPIFKRAVLVKRSRNMIVRYAKFIYTKIVRGSGSPDYIARGWSLGVFVGCVVPVFCQLIVAVPLSFVLKGSKIGAAAGTFVTTPPTAVFIYPVQIWVGNRFLGGGLSFESIKKASTDMLFAGNWDGFVKMGMELIAAFFAGGLLWAAVMTPVTYILVRFLVVRYREMRKRIAKKSKFKTEQQ